MAFEIIEKTNKGWFKGPMPEEFILKAEKYLNLKFPVSFAEFLREKGNGYFEGIEFYGLCNDNFTGPIPDAIWLTMDERNSSGLDNELILICQSLEYYYAIDTGQCINGENPIVDIIPNSKRPFKIAAPDYGTFFLNEIKNML